ncbi:MAG: ATP-binding cassette domain-containing protein [Acidobacteria bacterium]|nr:ATP-binding cassette domain-containing protein [Acidobacteriota bacterium]
MHETDAPRSIGTAAHARELLRLMGAQRRTYAMGLVFVVVSMVTALAYPWAIRKIIDEGIGGGHIDRVNSLGLLMLVLLVSEGVGTLCRDYLFNLSSERLAADVRRRAFQQLLRQDIAFFDQRTTGEITARLASDIPNLQRLVGEELSDALRFALWGVGGTALLFHTSALLSIIVLLAVPPMIALTSVLGRKVKHASATAQTAHADTGTITEESIAGIRTVRAFSQERGEIFRYDQRIARAVEAARRKFFAASTLGSVSYMLGEGSALLALWVGGQMIVRGRLTSGALISFVLYAFLVARGFRNTSTYWTEALRSFGATEWIFNLLAREPRIRIEGGARPATARGRITFERVHFSYPTRPETEALAGIDITIAPGEMVAFVGRSGAGKSSLLHLLQRFYDPDRGRVLFDGEDIRHLDPSWLRWQMGIVMQEPVLFSRSIADNIRSGRAAADDADVRAAAKVAHAEEFITRLPDGYATPVGDRGVQLSGGQRQRLAIARAVLRRPCVLILDEATSALDAESESLVQDALRVLDYRPTTIIVAHRLSTVVNVDQVVVLDRGQIVAIGRHDTLLQTCDFYRQLVETQLVAA